MKKIGLGLMAMVLILGFAGSAMAATLNVPTSYSTIQSAIDAAAWGDTVLVAPGEYVQSIRLKAGVTVQSTEGPEVTVIRGDGSLSRLPENPELLSSGMNGCPERSR